MRLTKFVHSCLLIEKNNAKIFVDPGIYSWKSGIVPDSTLDGITHVVVTHAHPDHLNQDFVEAIYKVSLDSKWYGPAEVVNQLKSWGITGNDKSDDSSIEFIESKHADLSPWFGQQPDHTSYMLLGEVLVGGDCHTLTDGKNAKVFAGAINGGPWGGVVGYTKMIESMKNRPKNVVPLHDWHWNDEARNGIYARLTELMPEFSITFIALENGVAKEI